MNTERPQLGLAFGLSAALNLFLFLLIAWAMAVHAGLTSSARRLLMEAAGAAPPEPETVTLVLSPDPPEPPTPPAAGEKRDFQKFINSPSDTPPDPASPPPPEASRLISDRAMRAASEEDASPDGVPGMISQKGVDQPFLDLRDQDFQSGDPDKPRDTSAPAPAPVPTPPPAPQPTPTVAEKPPDPSTASPPSPAEPDSSAPAFRDQDSAQLIPLPAPGARPSPPAPPTAPRSPAAPLPVAALPPDPSRPQPRETGQAPGTRKSKLLGTISNKGPAALDAVDTPEGKFGQAMHGAIEKHWRPRLKKLASFVGSGAVQLVEIEFEIDRTGRISNVRLVNPDEANPVMQDCALSAVLDAKIPPPPRAIFEALEAEDPTNAAGGRIRRTCRFMIF